MQAGGQERRKRNEQDAHKPTGQVRGGPDTQRTTATPNTTKKRGAFSSPATTKKCYCVPSHDDAPTQRSFGPQECQPRPIVARLTSRRKRQSTFHARVPLPHALPRALGRCEAV